MDDYQWDVFISHASEDKVEIVLPIAERLQEAGFKVWLDQHELRPGYSLREQIDDGLAGSRFGVIVLSKAFMSRPWPRNELNAILSRDIAGKMRLIPVWYGVTLADVAEFSPILADRFAIRTTGTFPYHVADAIAQAMYHRDSESSTVTRLFLELLDEQPNSKKITDFLLAHSNVLSLVTNWHSIWCSARKALNLVNITESEDFILGTSKPGTEPTWPIYTIFFDHSLQPICDTKGHANPQLQDCERLANEHIYSVEPRSLVETVLVQHDESLKSLETHSSYRYATTIPIVVMKRRTELSPTENDFIRRTNQGKIFRLHTFDWLIEACRSLDFGGYR
jgi:hypothetical protein